MDNLTGAIEPAADLAPSTTLASLQSGGGLRHRRIVVLAVNVATCLALAGWMASVVGAGGWTSVDALLFGCFLVVVPWTVLGFWNALIGLWLLHGRRGRLEQAASFPAGGGGGTPPPKAAPRLTPPHEGPGGGPPRA